MNDELDQPRIMRWVDAIRMPWKDGGSETIELAVHPRGAPMGSFGWRVSLARVTSDGPFSRFIGVDRTLTVLDGDGLLLSDGAARPLRLMVGDVPYRLPGEASCRASLLGEPVTALNVMVDRDAFACSVTRLDPIREPLKVAGAPTLVVCTEGEVQTEVGTLGRYDALIVPANRAVLIGPGHAMASSFRRVREAAVRGEVR